LQSRLTKDKFLTLSPKPPLPEGRGGKQENIKTLKLTLLQPSKIRTY
jgi:hypothetical protein